MRSRLGGGDAAHATRDRRALHEERDLPEVRRYQAGARMSMNVLHFGNAPVPWNAGWSAEERYEIRPCRWVNGELALWSPHLPGEGKPLFAKPHMVRQRRSIAEMRCT